MKKIAASEFEAGVFKTTIGYSTIISKSQTRTLDFLLAKLQAILIAVVDLPTPPLLQTSVMI